MALHPKPSDQSIPRRDVAHLEDSNSESFLEKGKGVRVTKQALVVLAQKVLLLH